jgi:putative SOS response-associated peptidase YedK
VWPRARLSSDVSEIKLVFSIPPHRPTPNIALSWNVALTDPLPAVRYDARAGGRSLDVMRWGLVPFWAKDIKVGFANTNAKAEGIESKPAFREAFQRRRCLVPVVLGPETWPVWLGEEPADQCELKALLAPYPSEAMICWPVSARVGTVKNNDPSLIEPIAAAE